VQYLGWVRCLTQTFFKFTFGMLGEVLVEILGLCENFLDVFCERWCSEVGERSCVTLSNTLGYGWSETKVERFGER
jgi:hypothetical protein